MATGFVDKKVHTVFLGLREPKVNELLFGVEIEMEGKTPIFRLSKDNEVWNWVNDGSLKSPVDNIEYVFKTPLPLDKAIKGVSDLYDTLKKNSTVIANSMRAGVHIHVNCQNLTIRQLFTFLAAYHAMEIVITRSFGEDRVGNLFCLRLIDADFLTTAIRLGLESERIRDYLL